MNISTETLGRLYASGRNYLNLGLGFLCGVGLMSSGQQKGLLDAVQQMYDGAVQVVHGATSAWQIIVVVAAPIVGPFLARMASNSAKVPNQAQAIAAAVRDPNTVVPVEAKAAILDAAAESTPLSKPIEIRDAALANMVPSNKVVASR